MELEDILKLIDHVSAAGLQSFRYETEDLKLTIKGNKPVVYTSGAPVGSERQQVMVQTAVETVIPSSEQTVPDGKIVTSPLVGTFYVAPAEGAEPFVKVGDSVQKGQVLAIVEAMKLMNEIESDYDGVVSEVLVQDGELVEYGQPLFCIK